MRGVRRRRGSSCAVARRRRPSATLPDVTGVEGDTVGLNIVVTSNDLPEIEGGHEVLELVANFVPEAAVLSCGAAAAAASKACATRGACVGGVCTWELSWESAPALELSLPAADHGDFELRLVATATEPLTASDQQGR